MNIDNPNTKPIVFIDLIGTITKWGEKDSKDRITIPKNEINTIGKEYLYSKKELQYPTKLTIPQTLKPPVQSYRDTEEEISKEKDRELYVIENHQDILKELRQTCDLKLISNTNRIETLIINDKLNLGFDKRHIITKDDMIGSYDDGIELNSYQRLYPEAILLSNHPENSKVARLQRSTLGIEKEQQVEIQKIKLECLEINELGPSTSNLTNSKDTLQSLSEELDLNSKKRYPSPQKQNIQPVDNINLY
jgi:hypothetical protein